MLRSTFLIVASGALAFAVVVAYGALLGVQPASAEADARVDRWPVGHPSVAVCTRSVGRPSWITARQFDDLVAETAQRWSEVHEAISIDYRGNCAAPNAHDRRTQLNEISWDLATFSERSGVDSITLLKTTQSPDQYLNHIRTSRIVLRPWTIGPPARPAAHIEALSGLLGHELGHLLGLTHSDVGQDLMYGGPITARMPSAADTAALRDIYCP